MGGGGAGYNCRMIFLRRTAIGIVAGAFCLCPCILAQTPKWEAMMDERFGAAELVRAFPPKVRNANKLVVFEIAGAEKCSGEIGVSRWKAMKLPAEFPGGGKVASAAGFFTYDPPAKGVTAWHVNFADPLVFAYYGGALLAQDELQVAEHPILASVHEMLTKKSQMLTVEKESPTPILVTGVERRVKIATDANAAEGRPDGLYGNRFAAAKAEVIRKAVTAIDPPTISNILAIAAPRPGRGAYDGATLENILITAYTGFRAAREKSPANSKVEIHTGFWGCGAFGGSRTAMTALQIAAAKLAEVELVFHTADKAGEKDFETGKAAFEKSAEAASVKEFLTRIEAAKYQWGTSDGN
jgi:hypothetical protein